MITRIVRLKDIGRFVSVRSASGNEGEFGKVNVVYARNACGKTTLCDILRSLGTRDSAYIMGRKRIGESTVPLVDFLSGNNAHWEFSNGQWGEMTDGPRVLVYDQRFVNDNVFVGGQIGVEQKRNVYSLALGQKAIELNTAVEESGDELAKAKVSVSQCTGLLKALIPEGQEIEGFRSLEQITGVDAKITDLKQRIGTDKNKKAKADQIRKHGLLKKITIPSIPKSDLESVLAATLDDVALTAEGRIKEHLAVCADSSKVTVEWIKQGYEAQTGSQCPYCGQDMFPSELAATYRAFFSGALKQQERLRNVVRNVFQTLLGELAQKDLSNVITQNTAAVDWWIDACGLLLELPAFPLEEAIESYSRVLGVALAAIERKQSSLTEAVLLQESEKAVLGEIDTLVSSIQVYNNAIEIANEQTRSFQSSVEAINLDDLIRSLNGLVLHRRRYEENVVSAYQKYDEALTSRQTALSNKTRANEALKEESKTVFDAFGQKINEILSSFGVNFTVGNDGVRVQGEGATGQLSIKINVNGSSAQIDCSPTAADDPSKMSLSNTLSGGDCSALGLAFFLARLETDERLAASIVVIDDPYHDQDRSRQAQTISLLKKNANACSQFFLFAHNLEFAQMFMSDRGVARNEIRAFEIPQLGSSVELKHGELPQLPSKSYETDYSELSGYMENPEQYQDRQKEIVGRIRPLLETYLRSKYPLTWEENDWLGEMIRKIRTSQTNDIIGSCQCLVTKLEDLNTYTQRFHHRVTGVTADVLDLIELQTYVRLALEIVHHA